MLTNDILIYLFPNYYIIVLGLIDDVSSAIVTDIFRGVLAITIYTELGLEQLMHPSKQSKYKFGDGSGSVRNTISNRELQ